MKRKPDLLWVLVVLFSLGVVTTGYTQSLWERQSDAPINVTPVSYTHLLALGQEEGHVDVGQIHQVEQLAAGAEYLAGLRDAVLHAAGARRPEQAVVDVHLQAFDAGAGRLAGRLRLDGL